jgi:alanine dehydrogenase
MLIIGNDVVSKVLKMEDCIKAQEAAFRQIPSGGSIERPRCDVYFPCEREDGYFRWGEMEGASGGYFAIRMKSDIALWPKDADGNYTTEEKYCIAPGTYCGLIMLVSTKNAEPLAFINDGILQHMRVGGGAGIGTKYLSRDDSHVVGMLGSGGMARTYLEAISLVRNIGLCKVFSPNPEHREAFADEMSKHLGLEVRAVDTARAAMSGSDIFATCTDSIKPVYDLDWIEKGMHVTNLNQHDTPPGIVKRADVVVRQGVAALNLPEGERFQSMRGGTMGAFIGGTAEEMKRLPPKRSRPGAPGEERDAGDRGYGGKDEAGFVDLVSGKCKGRTSPEQITFYRNQGLQGLQFASVGAWVYEQAVKLKLGREIPTDWFVQDIRD